MSITIDVSEAIAKIDPDKMEKAIESSLADAASVVRREARQYPPPKPTYTRQFILKKGWTQQVRGLQAIIGNSVEYAPYVQDSTRQAWMHRGYWLTTADIAQKKAEDVKRVIEAALARWAR